MPGRIFAWCALVAIAALITVGAVSNGVVRHIIQTLPLWIIVVLGLRDSALTKWAVLPIFLIWLIVMALIWLFLLRILHIVSGSFSPVEIAMTFAVGAGCLWAIVRFFTGKRSVPPLMAAATLAGAAMLQVGAIAISLQPPLDSDSALMAALQAH